MKVQEKIDRFNVLQKKLDLEDKEKQELNRLAEEFLVITKQAYDHIAFDYCYADRTSVMDCMIEMYNTLFQTAEEVLHKSIRDMTVLDVGTGTGKDIKYMNSKGITKVIGLDNSDKMIEVLEELQKRKEIPENSFMKGDMLDKAIQETNRVLKQNGILFD